MAKTRFDEFTELSRGWLSAVVLDLMNACAVAEALKRLKEGKLYEVIVTDAGDPHTWKSFCEYCFRMPVKDADKLINGRMGLEQSIVSGLQDRGLTRGEACQRLWDHVELIISGELWELQGPKP